MRKSDKELFGQLTLKEHYKSTKFAIQTLFSYGWDYIGYADDGLRTVYKTQEEAQKFIDHLLNEEYKGDNPDEWQTVPYNPHKDDTFARYNDA